MPIMSAAARADFAKRDSTDFAYAVDGIARFRDGRLSGFVSDVHERHTSRDSKSMRGSTNV